MTRNMANIDRLLRAVVVAPLAVLAAYLLGWTSAAGIILVAVAAVMLLTALTGFCPLYAILGLRTRAVH